MGVEPTQGSLAASPGFEVRTPHRGRCSSMTRTLRGRREKVQKAWLDPAQRAAPEHHAVTVEELQHENRHLAPAIQTVAERRSGEPAIRGMCLDIRGDLQHLVHGATQEVVVVADLVHETHARDLLQQFAYLAFGSCKHTGDVAHARWTETCFATYQWHDRCPSCLAVWTQLHRMAGKAYERASAPHPARKVTVL